QTEIGKPYLYQVLATDPDNNPLTYSLTSVTPAPATGNLKPLTINASTGLLTWTPLAADLNTFTITLQVSDGRGGTATQTCHLQVTAGAVNHPPVITTLPPLNGMVGQPYTYNAQGVRSEERRVGKEERTRWKQKQET